MQHVKQRNNALPLGGMNWELKGFWPWVPVKGTSMEIGNELMGVTDWIPATVPGGVHHDLYRAGLIENPYIDLNSLKCEWVENRWWVYRCCFEAPALDGAITELLCKGLDYEALVYWNGTLLGEHTGMYEPAVFDVSGLLVPGEQVELLIVLKHAPDEMGQIGKTSQTFTQKSRFNYKWDFSTRLVNTGIWDEILLQSRHPVSLGDIHVQSDTEDGLGVITVQAGIRMADSGEDRSRLLALSVRVLDPAGQAVAAAELQAEPDSGDQLGTLRLLIPQPELWYPNGYGKQPLYTVEVTLQNDGRAVDARSLRTGIRKLRYTANEGAPADALPYTIVINGVKIYIKGANLTPLDHLYGNVDKARYDWMVHLAAEANMNMLRIWGGGIIEQSYFYELCDAHGLLVWQEFIQSSSGIDNEPSKRPEFLRLLKRSAVSALKSRRNHVSLSIWSGGNELMSAPNVPSTYDDENLQMLKGLVAEYDPRRLFLPTSASGPVQYITAEKGVSHDVHGHWKYEGNPQHYVLYGEADHLFHSEFGVDGLSSVRSIRKFLSREHQQPVPMTDSLVWRHHGEWWDTYNRDLELFGRLDSLERFAECSQWMQAEGLRFILEANRRRQFNNSGSIIWQLNEPWPNVTCTNLVDYYNEPKMAYYWVKEAFAPFRASLDYRSLNYTAGQAVELPVYVVTNGSGGWFSVTAQLMSSAGEVLAEERFNGTVERGRALLAGSFAFAAPETADGLFYVRLRSLTDTSSNAANSGSGSGSAADNTYFFSTRPSAFYAPALDIHGAVLEAESSGDWQEHSIISGAIRQVWRRSYTVRNTGSSAALHVQPVEDSDHFWMNASESCFTLFPGEERTVRVTCCLKKGELFTQKPVCIDEGSSAAETLFIQPVIQFTCFGSSGVKASR